jgi:hypothetical protein
MASNMVGVYTSWQTFRCTEACACSRLGKLVDPGSARPVPRGALECLTTDATMPESSSASIRSLHRAKLHPPIGR